MPKTPGRTRTNHEQDGPTARRRARTTDLFEEERAALDDAVISGMSIDAENLPSTLSSVDAGTRNRAVTRLQQQQGNRFVQRRLDATQERPTVVARAPEEEKAKQGFFGSLGGPLDFAKNLLGTGKDNVMDNVPGLGVAFDALGDITGRAGRGQGLWQSLGGGLTKGLTSGLLKSKGAEAALDAVGKNKGLSSGMGLAGSGLKFLGGLMGEKESPDIGVTDVGEYVDVGSKVVNPSELVKQGIQEGMTGWYDLAQAGGDWLATGSTDQFMEMGEEQLKGTTGPITQGYSMIANVIGSAAIGDWSEMDRIGEMASAGKLGALPKLGSKIGDLAFELIHGDLLSDIGGSISGAASSAWDWTKSTAGKAASSVGGAASGAWDWMKSNVGGAASSAWDWTTSAASDVAGAASGAWDWTKSTVGDAASSVGGFASDVGGAVSGAASDAWDVTSGAASDAWDTVTDWF